MVSYFRSLVRWIVGKMRLVLTGQMIFLLLAIFSPYITAYSQEISHLLSAKCDHLKLEQGQQYNAYIKDKLLCCMCQAGYRLAGDCSATHPNTTVCEECPFDPNDPNNRTYIDFDAHTRSMCFTQKILHCLPSHVLYIGSSSEKAKCECPEGMEEAPDSQRCIRKNSSTSTIMTRILQTSTKSEGFDQTTSANATTSTLLILPTVSSDAKSHTRLRTTTPITESRHASRKPPDMEPGYIEDNLLTTAPYSSDTEVPSADSSSLPAWLIVVLTIAFLLLSVVSALYLVLRFTPIWKRNGEKRNDSETPVGSNQHLIREQRSGDVAYTVMVTEEGSKLVEDQARPPRMPQHQRIDEDPVRQRLLEEVVEQVPEVILHQQHQGFGVMHPKILEIRRQWQTEIRPNCIRRVFRVILKPNSEGILDDIVDTSFKGNTPEQVVQLMLKAHEQLGDELTPEYLLLRLNQLEDNRNLRDIVRAVIDSQH